MPELPEVENVVRKLHASVAGRKIVDVSVLRDRSFQGNPEEVVGLPITKVTRRAKLIRFHLPDNKNILSHLKMTGQFIYVDENTRLGGGHPTSDWVNELPSSHTRVVLGLSGGATLFFNDMRVFGWLHVMSDERVAQEYEKYGPDVIDNAVTPEYLRGRFSRTSRAVKLAIMDNNIMSGVGNIYACDALNLAQIDPHKPAKELTEKEIGRLLESAQAVINLGIKTGGATIDNYKHVDGLSGSYQNHVLAYGREGEKCLQCGGEIVKSKIGGRGTYYCGSCQQ